MTQMQRVGFSALVWLGGIALSRKQQFRLAALAALVDAVPQPLADFDCACLVLLSPDGEENPREVAAVTPLAADFDVLVKLELWVGRLISSLLPNTAFCEVLRFRRKL
jgi:hypothetical protein